jgi:hypothetical protein
MGFKLKVAGAHIRDPGKCGTGSDPQTWKPPTRNAASDLKIEGWKRAETRQKPGSRKLKLTPGSALLQFRQLRCCQAPRLASRILLLHLLVNPFGFGWLLLGLIQRGQLQLRCHLGNRAGRFVN